MVVNDEFEEFMLIGSGMGISKKCYVIERSYDGDSKIKYSYNVRLATVSDLEEEYTKILGVQK